MLEKMFNTLRVLVDGPQFPEDTSLIPTDIFANRTNFTEAVIELFEKTNTHDVAEVNNFYDFVRYCVCVDTSIRHRLDDNSGGYIDGALIQPSDYVDTLNIIDRVFSVTDESFGVSVASGEQHANPTFSGLTGAFLLICRELLDESQFDVMKIWAKVQLDACKGNPSATTVWWLDTLREIYSYESSIDGEDDVWLDPTGENDNHYLIQKWYLQLVNSISNIWNAFDEASQNLPEHAFATQLVTHTIALQAEFAEEFEDKFEEGLICETVPMFKGTNTPHNIEQCLLVLLAAAV